MVNRWIGWILLIFLIPIVFLLSLIASAIILLPFVVATLVLAGVLYLITKLGMHISPEEPVETIFEKTIGKETFEEIRDDLLIAFYPGLQDENFENLDRWSTLRQIDMSRDRVIKRVFAGSSTISVAGGLVSVIIGYFTSFGWTLAIFLVLVAILVSVGLVIIRTLTFSSRNHEFDPLDDLAIMKGWNDGPMQDGVAIAQILGMVLVISVFAKPRSQRYDAAMKRIQNHACKRSGIDPHKWETIEEVDGSTETKLIKSA